MFRQVSIFLTSATRGGALNATMQLLKQTKLKKINIKMLLQVLVDGFQHEQPDYW